MLLYIIDAANKEHTMSKLFTVAGTSVLEGTIKFRVANGTAAARTKVLEKNGHTEIFLQDLPTAMSKEDAMAFFSYTEGNVAKVAKAPKDKIVEKTFKIKNKTVAAAPKSEKTPEEIAAVKAKNLETLKAVSTKVERFSAETEAMQQQARTELEEINAEMDKLTREDFPKFLWKEIGFAE